MSITEAIRQQYIDYLKESEPWGIWTDKENIANGIEPLTLAELLQVINELEY